MKKLKEKRDELDSLITAITTGIISLSHVKVFLHHESYQYFIGQLLKNKKVKLELLSLLFVKKA